MDPATAFHPPRAHLDRLCRIVEERAGLNLPPQKRSMIESRLRRRVESLGLRDLETYLERLFRDNAIKTELPEIVDLLTTNKTDFFREPGHFDLLARVLVPEALARHGDRPVRFRLWSAAASTGAEAWSAAMVLARAAAAEPRLDWAVLGTDISPRVLEVARRAVYPAPELGPVPEALRKAYTMVGRAKAGGALARIAPELRARVRFSIMNLMETPYPVARAIDAIMLRNVLIYFDPGRQARVIAAMVSHLRPGGVLMVGHTESMTVRHRALVQVAPAAFRLKEAAR